MGWRGRAILHPVAFQITQNLRSEIDQAMSNASPQDFGGSPVDVYRDVPYRTLGLDLCIIA